MNKELLQTQIAFFLKKEFSAFEALALEIKKQLGEADSQYLPVPSDAPVQIPRLIIKYENFNLQVFKNRVDLVFQIDYEQEKLEKVINILSKILGLSIGRIGFVKTFFVESSIETIKEMLPAKKLAGLSIKEINLRINILRIINNYNCNSIEKIDPGNIEPSNGPTKSGLIILKDCNTLAENTLPDDLSVVDLKNLINALNTETGNFVLI